MVLYLNPLELTKTNQSEILVIPRNDNETAYNLKSLKFGTQYSNIINNQNSIKPFDEHERQLKTYFEKLLTAKLIITDTLHISIFSYLLNIPCYTFNNKYGKIKNTIIQYLSNTNVNYIENLEDIKQIKYNQKNNNKIDFNFSLLLKELEG